MILSAEDLLNLKEMIEEEMLVASIESLSSYQLYNKLNNLRQDYFDRKQNNKLQKRNNLMTKHYSYAKSVEIIKEIVGKANADEPTDDIDIQGVTTMLMELNKSSGYQE